MSMKKRYYTVNGEIIGEQTTGQERIDYLTDPLGNVTATIDQNAKVLNRYTYKPFGELLSKTGTAPDPKFLWVGAHGYRQTGKKYADVYVRARHYDTRTGRWTTRDPLWPGESAYGYGGGSPTKRVDPMGMQLEKGVGPLHPDIMACLKLSPGACFLCLYRYYRKPRLPGHENFCPEEACLKAKKLCGSQANCSPCGPGSLTRTPPDCGFTTGSIWDYGDWLRTECGGDGLGADKLAHCWVACMMSYCWVGPMTCLKLWLDPDDDPKDAEAEKRGVACGVIGPWVGIDDCMQCCRRAIFTLPCKP
jgi:RHS repeat-associated protein